MNSVKSSSSTDSRTRLITVCDNMIIYTLKLDNKCDYLSYNDNLYNILKLDKLKPFRNTGRLCFKIRANGTDKNIYLYDLAFACYSGQVKYDTFLIDIQKYYENKSFKNLSIDHADNNIYNNTEFNLSSMEMIFNQLKSDIISRVKEPVYLTSAYCNNTYRVQMQFVVKSAVGTDVLKRFFGNNFNCSVGLCAIHFLCVTAEEYVRCLKWLVEQRYEWAEPLKNGCKWVKNDNICWCSEITNSLKAQNILSNLPLDLFQMFVKQ